MNPSSSSNVEPAEAPVFHVQTRALARDLTAATASESPHDLGAVNAAQLLEIVRALNALDSSTVDESDAHLVVKAPRGRLTLRPHARGCILAPLDASDAYVVLPVEEIPAYLAGMEPSFRADAEPDPTALEISPPPPSRRGLALALFGFSGAIVAVSAFFTFRPAPTDPDSAYSSLAVPAQIEAVRARAIGRFSTPYEDGGRTLEIRADGTLTWTEYGPRHEQTDQRTDRYTVLQREGQPVLRASELGPITLPQPGALAFAGEIYTRETR